MPARTLTYLRLAVTSRCNLRCVYCQPHGGEGGRDLLSQDEIVRFVRVAVDCGIRKVRLTGGEPLLRTDIVGIVGELAALPALEQLGLTTNGCLLPGRAEALWQAGLRRINLGLCATDPAVYRRATQSAPGPSPTEGLHAALAADFQPVKVNVVVMRGINDGEIAALGALARDARIEVRFIEYMPFGADAAMRERHFVPAREVVERLGALGELTPLDEAPSPASARRYRIAGHQGTIGIIAPHSAPFCHACNRVRLTAEGRLRACLIDGGERDILPLIRRGLDRATMARLLAEAAAAKPARHRGTYCGQMGRIGG